MPRCDKLPRRRQRLTMKENKGGTTTTTTYTYNHPDWFNAVNGTSDMHDANGQPEEDRQARTYV